MKIKFYWHIHHDVLLEPLTQPLKNRIKFIKENKPKNEIELRLKLLKPVRGKLPDEVVKARKVYVKAQEAYYKAQEASDKVRKAHDKAWETYDKARKAYDKAWETYDKAREDYDKTLKKYSKEINELHEKECPNCPWNGKTIFN